MSSGNIVDKFGRKKKNQHIIIRERRGVGFKLTDEGDYDIQTKRLVNLGEPEQSTDGVTVGYVDSVINQSKELVLKALTESILVSEGTLKKSLEAQVALWKKFVSEHNQVLSNRMGGIENKNLSLTQLASHNRVFLEGQINRLQSDTSGVLSDIIIIKESIDKNTKILSNVIGGLEERIKKLE